MSIEKMTLLNIIGDIKQLDKTLAVCLESGSFHPEDASALTQGVKDFKPLTGENHYLKNLKKVVDLAVREKIELHYHDYSDLEGSYLEQVEFIERLNARFAALDERKRELKEIVSQYEQATLQLKHIENLDVNLEDIFSCQYIKVRFGRLPNESFAKLKYYEDMPFFFFPFDDDGNYHWGFYFSPASEQGQIDEIFLSLYFERIRVPDYAAHGTPEEAKQTLLNEYNDKKEELAHVRAEIKRLTEENREKILKIYSHIKFASDSFDIARYVSVLGDRFYLMGFIPTSEESFFEKRLKNEKDVEVVFRPSDSDPRLKLPVKLKNGVFSKPFEMFVEMYGLPSYNDIDPTPFVGFTYSLLFGIMFGDLGQGLVISLLGFLLYKFKKVTLGPIMLRFGLSSAVFGTLYGSVFGFEHALDPLWRLFGFAEKPIEVMEPSFTNVILGGAIVLGAVIIVCAMGLNIFMGLRHRDYGRALFSQNGVAGLLFYLTLGYLAVSILLPVGGANPALVAVGMVVPLLVIFFKEPLTKLAERKKEVVPENKGEFFVENFFELFEVVLSFLTNTMSFLRVGGFILSHAGMMAVVFTLSSMVSESASPVVIVLGNIFVMGVEGLIVGIQALRLEFYEMFSRFYEGDGKPFQPVRVRYEQQV